MVFYRIFVISILTFNLYITFFLYKAYRSVLYMSHTNLLVSKAIARHYDLISNMYTNEIDFYDFYLASQFLEVYKLLPTSKWQLKSGGITKDLNSSLDDSVALMSFFSDKSALFNFKFFKLFYDFTNSIFSYFGFFISPSAFVIGVFSLIIFLTAYALVFWNPEKEVLFLNSKRIYQIESFVAQKLNDGKPLDLKSAAWSPQEVLRRDTPMTFVDPYHEYWLQDLEREEEQKEKKVQKNKESETDDDENN